MGNGNDSSDDSAGVSGVDGGVSGVDGGGCVGDGGADIIVMMMMMEVMVVRW